MQRRDNVRGCWVVTFLLVEVAVAVLAEAVVPVPDASIAAFEAWVASDMADVEKGAALASQRVQAVLELAAADPAAALTAMDRITQQQRAALPVAVQAVMEVRMDVHGNIDVLHCVNSRERRAQEGFDDPCASGPHQYTVSFDSQMVPLVGTDLPATSLVNVPVHGHYVAHASGKRLFVKAPGHLRCDREDDCFVGSRRLTGDQVAEAHKIASRERHLASLSPADRSIGQRKTMVVFVDYDDATKDWTSIKRNMTKERELMVHAAQVTAAQMHAVSFGRLTIDLTFVPGTFTIKYDGLRDAGQINTLVEKQLKAANLTQFYYEHYYWVGFYIPPTNPYFGAWSGLASVPGKWSWFQDSSDYIWLHEWGHNMGFGHANAHGGEYGNQFDDMGGGGFDEAFQTAYRHGAGWVDDANVLEISAKGEYPEYAAAGAKLKMVEADITTIHDPQVLTTAGTRVAIRTLLNADQKEYLYVDVQNIGENEKKASINSGVVAGAIGGMELEDLMLSTTTQLDSGLPPNSAYLWQGKVFHCCDGARLDTIPYSGPRAVFQTGSLIASSASSVKIPMRAFMVDDKGNPLDGLGCSSPSACSRSFDEIVQRAELGATIDFAPKTASDVLMLSVPISQPALLGVFVCSAGRPVRVTSASYRSARPPIDVAMYGAQLFTSAVSVKAAEVVTCDKGYTLLAKGASDIAPEGAFFAVQSNSTVAALRIQVTPVTSSKCDKLKFTVPSFSWLNGIWELDENLPIVSGKPHYVRGGQDLVWQGTKYCVTARCYNPGCGVYACANTGDGKDSIYTLHTLSGGNTIDCACPAGSYDPQDGTYMCKVCPTHMTSAEASMGAASCGCVQGYSPDATGACVACAAGTYKSTVGSAKCTACPVGTSSPVGSADASMCAVAQFCKRMYFREGTSGWEDTYTLQGVVNGKGWYAADSKCRLGSRPCTLYPSGNSWIMSDALNQGYYWAAWGSSAYKVEQLAKDVTSLTVTCLCDLDGTTDYPCQCLAGQAPNAAGKCTTCDKGSYAVAAEAKCKQCPAWVTSSVGAQTQPVCDILKCQSFRMTSTGTEAYAKIDFAFTGVTGGQYRYASGSYEWRSPLTSKPTEWTLYQGTSVRAYGKTASDQPHLLSTVGPSSGTNKWTWACRQCAVGYVFNADSSDCVACPAGQSTNLGDAACSCAAGKTLVNSQCVSCPADTAKSTVGDGACTACATGLVPVDAGRACGCPNRQVLVKGSCVAPTCRSGFEPQLTSVSTFVCNACGAGKYSVDGSACKTCLPGMAATNSTKVSCACLPGLAMYKDQGCFEYNALQVTGSKLVPAATGTYRLALSADGTKVYRSRPSNGLSIVKTATGEWALVPNAANPLKRLMYTSDQPARPQDTRGWRVYDSSKKWFVQDTSLTITPAIVGTPEELGGTPCPPGATSDICEGFQWAVTPFVCQESCGSSQAVRQVRCMNGTLAIAADSVCAGVAKPATTQSCFLKPCAYSWVTTSWSRCSAACGAGVSVRNVTCVDQDNKVAADSKCAGAKPAAKQSCMLALCGDTGRPQWRTGDWSTCSVGCGGGTQTRTVSCVNSELQDVTGCTDQKPAASQACNLAKCETYAYQYGGWGECSKPCNTGKQYRAAVCVGSRGSVVSMTSCASTGKPVTVQDCNTQQCPTYKWTTGEWRACSKVCGGGTRTRDVTCVTSASNAAASETLCDGAQKPKSSEPCNGNPCKRYWWSVSDWGACSAACNGVQTRTATCVASDGSAATAADCSSSPPATSTACGSGCTFCNAVSSPCSGHGQCSESACQCTDGYTGARCHTKQSCAGVLTAAGVCCAGVLDKSGDCCAGANAKLDRAGACCASGVLNACGQCVPAGQTDKSVTDVTGKCCTVLDAAGYCCDGQVDACGVCNGVNSCNMKVTAAIVAPGYVNVADLSDPSSASRKTLDLDLKTSISSALRKKLTEILINSVTVKSGRLLQVRELSGSDLSVDFSVVNSDPTTTNVIDASQMQDALTNGGGSISFSAVSNAVASGDCGNGVCEVGERCDARDPTLPCCSSDCPVPIADCPAAANGDVCSNHGVCTVSSAGQASCSCYSGSGYAGAVCGSCAGGFVSDGSQCTIVIDAQMLTATNNQKDASSDNGISGGGIAGIVIAVIVLVAIIAGVVYYVQVVRPRRAVVETQATYATDAKPKEEAPMPDLEAPAVVAHESAADAVAVAAEDEQVSVAGVVPTAELEAGVEETKGEEPPQPSAPADETPADADAAVTSADDSTGKDAEASTAAVDKLTDEAADDGAAAPAALEAVVPGTAPTAPVDETTTIETVKPE